MTTHNDLSYIPLNNEQNEPTQAIRNEFEELYVSANEELYLGCDYVTRLDFMAKFTYFKVKVKLTDSIFNEMLEFIQNVFPTNKGHKLPPSYYEIKKTFKMIRPLINDLKDLWALKGVETIDVAICQTFNMRAIVLWTINDFLARSSLSGCSGQGYKACHTCNKDTPSMRVLGKIAYVGHKGFLTNPYKWRRSLDFNGKTEDGDPPRKFDRDQIMDQLSRLPIRVKGKHPSPEIDMYQAKFKSEFPNQDMKEEFLCWFGWQIPQRHIDKDPGVSASSELFALACGPTLTPISVNSYVVNDVRFVVHSRNKRLTTQNNDICSPSDKDKEMYYGQLEDILKFLYMSFKVVLFQAKWFDTSNEGRVIVVEDDHDVIHFDNSSYLALSTSLNDLDFTTLHIDGQSMDVDALPDIIDIDEDDDIIDDEDVIPHDLAYSDDEDLVNVDDDDVAMSANVARGHGGDGGGDDCKGTRKPNLGGRKANSLNTRKETKNPKLRKIMDQFGPQAIRFEWSDRGTLMPLGGHAAHWANLLGEIVWEFPTYFRSWHNIPEERKAGVLGKIGIQFDLTPHMQSDLWPKIKKDIERHLAKIHTNNKSSLKAYRWVANLDDGTYDVEGIRSCRPANISVADWDAHIAFLSDPKNIARCAQNAENQAKSTVICWQESRSLAVL
uniref:DUF4218 domain-containing protein n=1 Tax=Tanacetum cinerariifolium TaxID=118510 RepID=A0A699HU85_TANCI|nr:hypothetical protein [Tanacetum cinerariifolium]